MLAALFCLTLVLAIAAGLIAYRYRVQPLEGPTTPHMVEVLGAHTETCMQAIGDIGRPRLVILDPASASRRPIVFVNRDASTFEKLPERLTDLFKVRAERTVFLIDSSDRDLTSWIALERLVQHVPTIDRICVIDPKKPPSWYPPPPAEGAPGTTRN